MSGQDSESSRRAGSVSPERAHFYRDRGWWSDDSISSMVRRLAEVDPGGIAYIGDGELLTWREYNDAADALAAWVLGTGIERGSRVAVLLPDVPLTHVAYVACERAGVVIVGIPGRAGDREIAHLLARTDASLLLTLRRFRDRTAVSIVSSARRAGAPIPLHAELSVDGGFELYEWVKGSAERRDVQKCTVKDRQLSTQELWMLNSTSGTTGRAKCVEQFQDRWKYLVRIAEQAAQLNSSDVLMSVVPSPFGFGLWTAHFAPAMIGFTCVLHDGFNAEVTLRSVAEHGVTVLACVTTQLTMMLSSPAFDEVDLSTLRVLYTGGERVPPMMAREWEQRAGSTVLQFYGSNEMGPFSCTSLRDREGSRLTTVGRVVPGLDFRIYDESGRDVTAAGVVGQPGAISPGVCNGYWNDDEANEQLFSADGYLLMADLVTIDAAGYVRIEGRKSDIIIRGGKNISAAGVEADVGGHPAVEMVAALPVADPVFGERVCVVVTLRQRTMSLSLSELISYLTKRGVSKEYFPEYLVVIDEMPQSSGGKIAKNELAARLASLLEGETR